MLPCRSCAGYLPGSASGAAFLLSLHSHVCLCLSSGVSVRYAEVTTHVSSHTLCGVQFYSKLQRAHLIGMVLGEQ